MTARMCKASRKVSRQVVFVQSPHLIVHVSAGYSVCTDIGLGSISHSNGISLKPVNYRKVSHCYQFKFRKRKSEHDRKYLTSILN